VATAHQAQQRKRAGPRFIADSVAGDFGGRTACEWISQTLRRACLRGPLAKGDQRDHNAGGVGVRWTAIVALGKSFSSNVAIRESQKAPSNGAVSIRKAPVLPGMCWCLCIGCTLAVDCFCRGAGANHCGVLYRIHVEELALREAFGADYVAVQSDPARTDSRGVLTSVLLVHSNYQAQIRSKNKRSFRYAYKGRAAD